MNSSEDKPGLFARLRHHHIYRVVVVYAIAAWILIQVSNTVFPDFGFTRGDVRVVIVVLLCGFPLTLVVAWMFIQPQDPSQYNRWQKLHWKLGATLSAAVLVAVVISGWSMWRYSERHPLAETPVVQAAVPAAASFNPPANTLVVLPFENMNGDPKQQYFSDGITQELTDVMGRNPALQVIAWNTASTFRDSKLDAIGIGKALNVANLLHGSVLRQGAEVRVTVELVNTIDDYQLWSAQYDEPVTNIFAVQDKIARAVADTLRLQLAESGRLVTQATLSPQAYDFYLRGRLALNRGSAASLAAAEKNFESAIAIDPHYADAYARLAHVYYEQLQVSTLPLNQAVRKIRAAVQQALALDPRNVAALVAMGSLDSLDNHPAKAKAAYEAALAINPSEVVAHVDYGLILPLKQALAQDQEAVLLDPRNYVAQNNLAADYLDLADYEGALAPALAMAKLSPDQIDSAFILAFSYQQLHRDRDMVAAFDLVKPAAPLDKQLVAAAKLAYGSLLRPDLRSQALAALESLRRAKLSPYSKVDLLQLYLVLGENKPAWKLLREVCTSDPVACADLTINPVYTPLRGDRSFQKLAKRYTTVTLE